MPRWARALVCLQLGAMVLCPLLGVEAWPFSELKLFSQRRTGIAHGVEIIVVDHAGQESPFRGAALGRPFRQATSLAASFPTMSAAERLAACRSWAEAADAAGARVYRLERRVPMEEGVAGALVSRVKTFECST